MLQFHVAVLCCGLLLWFVVALLLLHFCFNTRFVFIVLFYFCFMFLSLFLFVVGHSCWTQAKVNDCECAAKVSGSACV